MPIISVANQKGGVGKTTSVINLAYSFSILGQKTLIVDLDPQGNATSGLGCRKNLTPNVRDLLNEAENLNPPEVFDNLFLFSASEELVGFDAFFNQSKSRETLLKHSLKKIEHLFNIVLIDTPPSTGLLSVNALVASEWVLVPVQAEYYALEGLSGLIEIVEFIKQTANPNLKFLGFFLTMYDSRTLLSRQVDDELRRSFTNLVFDVRIPRSVRVAESPSHGKPLLKYDPTNLAGLAYLNLADRIISKLKYQ